MHVQKYANMKVCKYASFKCASMQVYKFAYMFMDVCKDADRLQKLISLQKLIFF